MTQATPPPEFPALAQWTPAIALGIYEDVGERAVAGDVTGRLVIPEDLVGTATLVLKAPGVVSGLPAIEPICRMFDARLDVDWPTRPAGEATFFPEASSASPVELLTIRGPVRSLLAAERTLLNLLGHLGGVATLTHEFVKRKEGTRAIILDTRKTTPGLRHLEKYAVLCGGGRNHRIGLHDMVLVKDNHLALAGIAGGEALTEAVRKLVRDSRAEDPGRGVEVEVDTLEQFERVLAVDGVDIILLDNMDLETLSKCVALRDEAASRPGRKVEPMLEASGGVTLETVGDIARTGVERISVGAITHSAPSLDLSLDVKASSLG